MNDVQLQFSGNVNTFDALLATRNHKLTVFGDLTT